MSEGKAEIAHLIVRLSLFERIKNAILEFRRKEKMVPHSAGVDAWLREIR